jgi:hypothetical protein
MIIALKSSKEPSKKELSVIFSAKEGSMHKLALIVATILLVGLVQPAAAVPIACTTMTTLDEYIGQSVAGGCFVQDKLFNDFSYAGGGAVTAADVGVTTVFEVLPTTDIQGFVFAPVAGAWTTNFTLGYSIAVFPPDPTVNIVGAKLQINTGLPNTAASATSTKSNGLVQVATGIPADETQSDLSLRSRA